MVKQYSLPDFLEKAKSTVVIDVRTPLEFVQGHIPGAVNIPIFTNEERVIVGTTYKQKGRQPAILLGFELTGPKWADFIRQAEELAPNKKVLVHCWRGGMRSGAMAWAFDLYGFEVQYQMPFTFLPEFWNNFGFVGNFTYVKAQLDYVNADGQILATRDLQGLSENTG